MSNRLSNIIGGSVLIVIGAIFFLNIIGAISFDVWRTFGTLWPIGLILIGIAIILRMRWLAISLVILTVILAASYGAHIINTGTITESGNITTKEYNLENFSNIRLDMPAELYITQGDTYNVSIMADKSILDVIDAGSSDGTLTIRYYRNLLFWNLWEPHNIKIYITTPDVRTIEVSGAGNIRSMTPIVSDNLTLILSGAGNMDFSAQAKSLTVKIQGFGNANIKGTSEMSDYVISGAGNIKAFELVSNDSIVSISGSGNAEVNAQKSLDVTISGAGNVEYMGDPKVTQIISGAGNVKKE